MSKLLGFLRLIRPVNCLMMGFAVVVGAALTGSKALVTLWQNLAYGFLTGFMLNGASMAINDYYDREIDAVNEPNRPIPSGLVKPKEALSFASILTAIGFAASTANSYYVGNAYCLVIAVVAWAVFVAYTTIGKRTGLPGNFLVSTCVSIPFIYGSYAVADKLEPNVFVFAIMVFLSNTGREITKGIVDVQGDRTQNVKTLAVHFGEKTAAIAASLFYLSAVSLSPIPWLLKIVSSWFIPLVAVTDLGLVASSFLLLRDSSRENARKVKNSVLLWFIFGLLAFVVGVLW